MSIATYFYVLRSSDFLSFQKFANPGATQHFIFYFILLLGELFYQTLRLTTQPWIQLKRST